jgi:hypothetical protein
MEESGRTYAGVPSFLIKLGSTSPAIPVGSIPEPSGVTPNPVPIFEIAFCSRAKPFAFPAAISASET